MLNLEAQLLLDVDVHLVNRTVAVNLDHDALTVVVLNERLSLGLIGIEALLDGLGLVVVTLVHLATAARADGNGRTSGVTAATAGAPGAQTLDDDVEGDINEQSAIKGNAHLGQLASRTAA